MATEIPLVKARAYVAARHGLSGAGYDTVHDATPATVGVFASAPTCYLSYAARVNGFRLADLDQALYTRRALVRIRCIHEMSFIEPVEEAPLLLAATNAGDDKTVNRILRLAELTPDSYAALAGRIEEVLTDRPPATVAELRDLLGSDAPERRDVLNYVVALMGRQARIVRAQVRGSWRSDTYAYARWAEWTGCELEKFDPQYARVELARRYLAAFGPATLADLKWWAGWTLRDTKAALAALGAAVVPVVLVDHQGGGTEVLALAETLDAFADAEDVRGVRLLPYWDTLMMGYALAGRQPRLVAPADHLRVYDRSGNGTSVVLIDGVAAGVWELEHHEQTLTVRIAPFEPAATRRWAEIEDAAGRIATATGSTELRVELAPSPGALADGARNAFMAPIRLGKPA